MLDCTDALCRTVLFLTGRIGTIDFDQHGVINVRAERSLGRLKISLVTIRRDLDSVFRPRCKIVRKSYRSFGATVADAPRRHKLGIKRGGSADPSQTMPRKRLAKAEPKHPGRGDGGT
jgi:hypothetical protein